MKKIIVSAEELISCPKCSSQFPLKDGITKQTLDKYEDEYDKEFKQREDDLRKELQAEIERRLAKSHAAEVAKVREELAEAVTTQKELSEKIEAVKADTRAKALKEFETEKDALQQDLTERDSQLKKLRDNELQLRRDKQKLEEAQQNLELEMARKLDEEKARLVKQIQTAESERFMLKEAELRKKIEDAQKANEDLKRKLEQGSQQLQGEVLELELEGLLRAGFPFDTIEPVKKGARGADVIQTVSTRTGQICGKIVWEAKRAENWSNGWITKLKEDQQAVGAEIAVLVTTTMPKHTSDPFILHDGVWVTSFSAARPLAEALREILIEQQKSRAISVGKNEKMEAIYDYLCSSQFIQRIRTVVDAYTGMKRDLDSERVAMEKIWKKREKQIERVTHNMMGMCGEIQAISQDSMPHLNEIGQLEQISQESELPEQN
jgi:hypothetical protein